MRFEISAVTRKRRPWRAERDLERARRREWQLQFLPATPNRKRRKEREWRKELERRGRLRGTGRAWN